MAGGGTCVCGLAEAGDLAARGTGGHRLAAFGRRLARARAESLLGGGRLRVALKHASVQTTRLGILAIQRAVVELPGGEYRAILEVSGTARPFADDARLEGVLAGFA